MSADKLYVRRREQEEEFLEILDNTSSAKGDGVVLFYSADGGQGKTWLIQRLLTLASGTKYKRTLTVIKKIVDCIDTETHHEKGFLSGLANLIKRSQKNARFDRYERAMSELQDAESKRIPTDGIKVLVDNLQKAFHEDLKKIAQSQRILLAIDTFENIQETTLGKWALSKKGLIVPGVILLLGSRKPNPFNPLQQLPGLSDQDALEFYCKYLKISKPDSFHANLASRLNALAKGNPLLLGLAIMVRQTGTWTNEEMDSLLKSPERDTEFRKQIISGLRTTGGSGERKIGDFLITDDKYKLLICMAYLHPRFNKFFLGKLIEHGYIKKTSLSVKNPVEDIWQDLHPQALFFVKQRPNDEIQLHDELKDILLKYLLDDVFHGENEWKRFSTDIVNWYDELVDINRQGDSASSSILDYLRFEQFQYAFAMKAPASKRYFRDIDFKHALNVLIPLSGLHSYVFDDLVANSIKTDLFEDALEDSTTDFPSLYRIFIMLGTICRRAFKYEISGVFCKMAADVADRLSEPEMKIDALIAQHQSTYQDNPQKSLEILDLAERISKDNKNHRLGTIFHAKGFINRILQDPSAAINWYERGLEISNENSLTASLFNDKGYANSLLGNYEDAVRDISSGREVREALRNKFDVERQVIREKLDNATFSKEEKESLQLQHGEISDEFHFSNLLVGRSFNTLGELKRYMGILHEATGAYSEAKEIFEQESAFDWLAIAYTGRAEAHRRLAMDLYYQHRKESVERYSRSAEVDIDKAREICQKYGLLQQMRTIFRRKGRILHDRALRATSPQEKLRFLDSAEKQFRTGLKYSPSNVLEELETLTEVAFLGDDFIDAKVSIGKENAERVFEGAENLANELKNGLANHKDDLPLLYQYPVFELLLLMEEAAIIFSKAVYHTTSQGIENAADFEQAKSMYEKAFLGLAKIPAYGLARYRQHLPHLFRNIERLPSVILKDKWYQDLMKAWKNAQLPADVLKDFLHQCTNRLKTLNAN